MPLIMEQSNRFSNLTTQELLEQILEETKWRQSRLAKELNTHQPNVSRWLQGSSPDGEIKDHIRELLERVHQTTDHAPEQKMDTVEPDQPYSEPTGGNVPEVDVRAQGGAGGYTGEIYAQDEFGNKITREGVVASWYIPEGFLKGELRVQVGSTAIIEVDGDSNSPMINPGDRLIIDNSIENITPDTIYLIDYGFGPAVKRISPVAGTDPQQCDIVSHNPDVPTQRVLLESVRVLGKVSGRIHRL